MSTVAAITKLESYVRVLEAMENTPLDRLLAIFFRRSQAAFYRGGHSGHRTIEETQLELAQRRWTRIHRKHSGTTILRSELEDWDTDVEPGTSRPFTAVCEVMTLNELKPYSSKLSLSVEKLGASDTIRIPFANEMRDVKLGTKPGWRLIYPSGYMLHKKCSEIRITLRKRAGTEEFVNFYFGNIDPDLPQKVCRPGLKHGMQLSLEEAEQFGFVYAVGGQNFSPR